MSKAMEIKIDGRKLMRMLKATPAEMYKALRTAAGDPKNGIGARYFGFHAARELTGTGGNIYGTNQAYPAPSKAVGFRHKSVRRVITEGTTLDTLHMRLVFANPLAMKHEVGGTIRSNTWMAVPMSRRSRSNVKDKVTTDKGRKTAAARQLLRDMPHMSNAAAAGFRLHSAAGREMKGLFVVRHKSSGKSFLARVSGRGKTRKLNYWFHLERSVQLKPKLDFRKLWASYIPTGMKRLHGAIAAALRESKKKAAGGAT